MQRANCIAMKSCLRSPAAHVMRGLGEDMAVGDLDAIRFGD